MRATLFLALVIGAAALRLEEQAEAVAKAPEDHGKAVFYAVIMGAKYTRRHQVSLWLSSLRLQKMGNWKGEAIIVTDKPKCLEKTLEETKMIGQKLHSNTLVDVYAPPPGMQGNLYIVKRPHTGNILKIKLEKARAWINLRNSGIEGKVGLIVYTDEDIVMGKDVNRFVNEVTSYVPGKHTLALFKDTGKSRGELHTGVVVMYNSPHAEECLRAWGKTLTGLDINEWMNEVPGPEENFLAKEPAKLADMDELEKEAGGDADTDSDSDADKDKDKDKDELMGPDQQALGRTKPCMAATNHQGIKILSPEFFWFPNPGGMANGKAKEFIHFTNTGRWIQFSRGSINSYLYKIGIPEYIDPLGHSHSEECLIAYTNITATGATKPAGSAE